VIASLASFHEVCCETTTTSNPPPSPVPKLDQAFEDFLRSSQANWKKATDFQMPKADDVAKWSKNNLDTFLAIEAVFPSAVIENTPPEQMKKWTDEDKKVNLKKLDSLLKVLKAHTSGDHKDRITKVEEKIAAIEPVYRKWWFILLVIAGSIFLIGLAVFIFQRFSK
jgi:hypothetical protein